MPRLDTTNTTTAETAVAKIWGDHAFHVLNLWHLGEYAPKETADIGILLFAPRMPPGRCRGPLPAMRIRFTIVMLRRLPILVSVACGPRSRLPTVLDEIGDEAEA